MAYVFHTFLSLPSELQFEVLWHCLVVPEPVALAYSGRRFMVGGRFLVENPSFFCILVTCRHIRQHGMRVFLTYNNFVFGDFLFNFDRFRITQWHGTWSWVDDRTCRHSRTLLCPHVDFETDLESQQRVDMGATFGISLDPPSLGKIKHLIIIHRFCDDSDNPGLAQTLLVVERLVRAHSRLTSLFIFLERDMHLPRLPLADWCLAMWGLIWPFLSPLMILCKQSPNIHVHISTYTREEPRPHPGPLGPHLCADSAASVRSYLLTRELDGGINGWNISPGVSFSNITVDSSFTSSADGRYLLEFGQNESYVMEMPGWGMTRRDTVRRSYLQRALRWHDHRGLLELDDPWFHYTLTTTDNEPSAFYELRSVCSALQLRLASGGLMPWTQWSPGFLSRDIEKSLWEFNSPASSLVKPEGADLRTVTAEWARLRLEELAEFDSERDNEHLNRLFVAMALFDAASAAGQRRITNYFAKVRVGDNLPM